MKYTKVTKANRIKINEKKENIAGENSLFLCEIYVRQIQSVISKCSIPNG